MDPLRKRRTPLPSVIKYLPVKYISENNLNKFTAYFVGDTIEIYNPEQIHELQNCGCFGDLPYRHRKNESHYLIQEATLSQPQPVLEPVIKLDVKKFELTPSTSASTVDLQQTNETMELDSEEKEVEETVKDINPVLTLLPEEAFYLHFSLKCLTVKDIKSNLLSTEELFIKLEALNSQFLTRFIAYHYLRSKNWVVRSGIKFGSDFLLYNLGPRYYHAKYMILVKKVGDLESFNFPSKETLAWYRIGETCGKECMLLEVKYPENSQNQVAAFSLLQKISLFRVNHVRLKRIN